VLGSDVEVIIELIGGLQPAHDWVSRALKSGKSVVTANKQLIAHHGAELIELARAQEKHLMFGACVAGGVPVLAGLHEGLAGDRLVKVCGILNGTCNYILSRMEQSGATFSEALEEAQAAGFAEADASEDVDGFDARAKLVVLARVGLNADVAPKQVLCRSIREVAHVDFDYARELACTIRQVSRAELRDGTLFAAVEPTVVPQNSREATTLCSARENLVGTRSLPAMGQAVIPRRSQSFLTFYTSCGIVPPELQKRTARLPQPIGLATTSRRHTTCGLWSRMLPASSPAWLVFSPATTSILMPFSKGPATNHRLCLLS